MEAAIPPTAFPASPDKLKVDLEKEKTTHQRGTSGVSGAYDKSEVEGRFPEVIASGSASDTRLWLVRKPASDEPAERKFVLWTIVTPKETNPPPPDPPEIVTITVPGDGTATFSPPYDLAQHPSEVIPLPGAFAVTVNKSLLPILVMQPSIAEQGTVGELEPVNEVRFCRWDSPGKDSALGSLDKPKEFPKEDSDRIVISVPLPHKAGKGPFKIHVSTEGAKDTPAGFDHAYNDAGAEIEIIEKKGSPGLFESKPIALVADEDDDNWAGGRAFDGDLNDPTFIGWPGGKLKIKIPELNNTIVKYPIKKFTHGFTWSYVLAGDMSGGNVDLAITSNLIRMREIYAQLHEKAEPSRVTPEYITQTDLLAIAASVPDPKDPLGKILSDSEMAPLIAKVLMLGLPPEDLKIVFVSKTVAREKTDTNSRGIAGQNQFLAGRNDIIMCFLDVLAEPQASATDLAGTVAHECGHSLRGLGHGKKGGVFEIDADTGYPLGRRYLMVGGETGIAPFIRSTFPTESAKHWSLADTEIVHEGEGNNFSKKLP